VGKIQKGYERRYLNRVRAVRDDSSIEYSGGIFNEALIEIKNICLTINNKALIQLGIVAPRRSGNDLYDRDLVREQQFNANDLRAFVEANEQLLLAEQKLVYKVPHQFAIGLYSLSRWNCFGSCFIRYCGYIIGWWKDGAFCAQIAIGYTFCRSSDV